MVISLQSARSRIIARSHRAMTSENDRGASVLDHLGAVLVAAVVVSLVATAVLAPSVAVRVDADVKYAVCAVMPGGHCQPPAGGDTGGPAGQSSSADPTGQQGQPQPAQDEDSGCDGFWGCTWSGIKQVGSGGYNIVKGAVDDVVGLGSLVMNPGQIVDAGKYIWEHPGDALQQMVWDNESGQMWDDGDYGGAIGRTIWNVGSWFIPGVDVAKGAAKFGKLGALGAKLADLAKFGDEAAAAAKTAKEAKVAGDLEKAQAAAADAQAAADRAKEAAKVQGCPIAAGLINAPDGSVVLAGWTFSGGGRLLAAAAPIPAAGPALAVRSVLRAEGCTGLTDEVKQAQADADAAKAAAAATLTPATIALSEAHLTSSGTAVLGHFPGYITKASAKGASYFDIGDAWNALTPAQRWGANTHFLDVVAQRSDQVYLSLPKTEIRPGSYLADEVAYLTKEKGYVWVNQWSLRPPG